MSETKKNVDLFAVLQNILDTGNAPERDEALQACTLFISACTVGIGNGFMVLPSSVGEGK